MEALEEVGQCCRTGEAIRASNLREGQSGLFELPFDIMNASLLQKYLQRAACQELESSGKLQFIDLHQIGHLLGISG